MPATESDFVLQASSGLAGTWVQLVNNVTSTTIVAQAATNSAGRFTVLNVPAGIYTLSTGPTAGGPFTAIDLNYVVPDLVGSINVKDYGAKGDGVTDDTTAFQNAINDAITFKRPVVVPGSATRYVIAGQLDMTAAGADGIEIGGVGSAMSGASTPSTLNFTGTASPLIKMSGARVGQRIRDLKILWSNNSFAGTALDLSGSLLAKVMGCYFGAAGGTTGVAAVCIDLDSTNDVLIDSCEFQQYAVGVRGLSNGAHFATAVTIRGKCLFSSSTGTATTAHISNPGQGWEITGNTFEMGQGAGNVVVLSTPLSVGNGMVFSGNWVGDQGANAVTQLTLGNGAKVCGNYLGGSAASTCISVPNNSVGISIDGNTFDTHSVAMLIGSTVNNIQLSPNRFTSVTTPVSGTPNSGGIDFRSGTANLYGATQLNGALQVTQGFQRSTQTPSETTLVSGVNANGGEMVEVTLTAARLVGAPTNPANGYELTFTLIQGGAGGFAVTWNAVFKVSWSDTGNTTGKRSTVTFWYDGTNWNQKGAQVPYV